MKYDKSKTSYNTADMMKYVKSKTSYNTADMIKYNKIVIFSNKIPINNQCKI